MMQKWQEELKKGNEKAFSIIFNEYYSLLCAVSYQYVQDVQISEAVAEDVSLHFGKSVMKFCPYLH